MVFVCVLCFSVRVLFVVVWVFCVVVRVCFGCYVFSC